MAIDAQVDEALDQRDDSTDRIEAEIPQGSPYGVGPLASLKLTVVLFALGILIILVGTLAQSATGHVGGDVRVFSLGDRPRRGQRLFPGELVPEHGRLGSRMLVALRRRGSRCGVPSVFRRNQRHRAGGVAGCLILLLGSGVARVPCCWAGSPCRRR